MMDSKELKIIQQLMEQLQGEMAPDEDYLSERLGRKKPKVEMTIMMGSEDKNHEDAESPEFETEEDMNPELDMQDDMSDEDKLKSRLMKLRSGGLGGR